MQKRFNLSNGNQISKWKSKGLSNQYLDVVGTLGDVVLSKPIKPIPVIFKGKGTLVQKDNDNIAGGPIVKFKLFIKHLLKLLTPILLLKIVYLVQLK